MATLPPDQAWRLEAACRDAPDPTIFDWLDASELGVENAHVRAANKERFKPAKELCVTCPVIAECELDAVRYGAISFTVRGGLDPYDREDVRPGRVVATPRLTEEAATEARQRLWNAWVQGLPLPDVSKGHLAWLADEKRAFVDREPDASWDASPEMVITKRVYTKMGVRHAWLAGEGWVVSQNMTRSVVKVVYWDTSGKLRSRLARSNDVRYDRTIAPRDLREWPNILD